MFIKVQGEVPTLAVTDGVKSKIVPVTDGAQYAYKLGSNA
jgi:hypothetical protein